MKDGMFEMKDFIAKNLKHLLYRDECYDDYLLLRWAEIFFKSNRSLGVNCFSRTKFLQIKRMGIIFEIDKTDDQWDLFSIKIKDLHRLLALGMQKRRLNKNSMWFNRQKKKIGHQIIPINPKLRDIDAPEYEPKQAA